MNSERRFSSSSRTASPPPVAGGAGPQVDHHIQDRAAEAADVLRLPGRDIGEVDAADDAPARHRAVRLRDLQPVAERGQELAAAEQLKETSPASERIAGVYTQAPSMLSGSIQAPC